MPWLPISQSGLNYVFQSDTAEMVGSAVAGTFLTDCEFSFTFPDEEAVQFRITALNYTAFGEVTTPAEFQWVTSGGPLTQPNTGGEDAFAPSPFIGEANGDGPSIGYVGNVGFQETFAYSFEVNVQPSPIDPIIVIGNYLRAYYGADTPQTVWVRKETGPVDLSQDTLTVSFAWPWGRWSNVPAQGFADGRVDFVVTKQMLWQTWGSDYEINRARWRGYRTPLRIISAERGVIALAYLEVA